MGQYRAMEGVSPSIPLSKCEKPVMRCRSGYVLLDGSCEACGSMRATACNKRNKDAR